MLSYQLSRPKPPHFSGKYESLCWRSDIPLQRHWCLQEFDGRNFLRRFFVYTETTLLQGLSDSATVALAAKFSVNGCTLQDADHEESAAKYVFQLLHPNGYQERFVYPYTAIMTPAEVIETGQAKALQEITSIRPSGVLDPTQVAFLKRRIEAACIDTPKAVPALTAEPTASEEGPSMEETFSWSKEKLFMEYWKLRSA